MKYEQHPLSAKFSRMTPEAINAMADDIKSNGLQHSILLFDGKVLDGWNRYQACLIAGINPRTTVFRGKDPASIVISENIHRRHDMTAGQRALLVVEIREYAPHGKPKGATVAPLATVAEMAEEAGTGERVVQQAKVVEANGTDTLKEAVRDGDIPVHKAAAVAKKPKAQQAKALKEAKEPKPKKAKAEPKKKKPALKPDDDSCSVAELGKALEESDKEVRELQALVESLKKDDLAKEVAKWHLKFDQLEGRLSLAVKQKNEADKHAKYSTGLLRKIREALKVTKDGEILQAIRNS